MGQVPNGFFSFELFFHHANHNSKRNFNLRCDSLMILILKIPFCNSKKLLVTQTLIKARNQLNVTYVFYFYFYFFIN
jgi:hypothetical protein